MTTRLNLCGSYPPTATATTGTNGHTLPFLDGANTWSGIQFFTDGDLALKGSSSGAGITAPQGVFQIDDSNGNIESWSIVINVRYRLVGTVINF